MKYLVNASLSFLLSLFLVLVSSCLQLRIQQTFIKLSLKTGRSVYINVQKKDI